MLQDFSLAQAFLCYVTFVSIFALRVNLPIVVLYLAITFCWNIRPRRSAPARPNTGRNITPLRVGLLSCNKTSSAPTFAGERYNRTFDRAASCSVLPVCYTLILESILTFCYEICLPFEWEKLGNMMIWFSPNRMQLAVTQMDSTSRIPGNLNSWRTPLFPDIAIKLRQQADISITN